jgi:hypothetical protein
MSDFASARAGEQGQARRLRRDRGTAGKRRSGEGARGQTMYSLGFALGTLLLFVNGATPMFILHSPFVQRPQFLAA